MKLLQVPYFRQMDNATGTGHRECASSACAMVAAYWGRVPSDDAYNEIRAPFGDTTDPQAHVKALSSLGLLTYFTTRATWRALETMLSQGRPCCLPYLHQGPVHKPSGFGHWCVGIGLDADQICIHDPMGDPRLSSGGFVRGGSGRAVRGSRLNFGRRWSPEGPGHGWLLTAWDPRRDPR